MRDDPAELLADELRRRGLAAPAAVLLDAHAPAAPLLSDLGVALGPLATLVGGSRARSVRDLMGSEDGITRLLRALRSKAGGHESDEGMAGG